MTFSTIIIGGFVGNYVAVSSVEVLDDNGASWKPGPSLPMELAAFTSVTDPLGSILVFGGHDKPLGLTASILRLKNSKSKQWDTLPFTLKTSRSWLLAISVPYWIFDCS